MLTSRTELFFLFFLPLLALEIVVGGFFYQQQAAEVERRLSSEDLHQVSLNKQVIQSELHGVLDDLNFLSGASSLEEFLRMDSSSSRQMLSDLFWNYSYAHNKYAQIRYIDISGKEMVRVDRSADGVALVAKERLQNKANRYYFKDTVALDEGEIFVSPLDLNVERGEIERPFKPMLRIATPIYDDNDWVRGALILNYFGSHLLETLRKSHQKSGSSLALLNSDGYWLLGSDPSHNWAFMFEDKKDLRFGKFYPSLWTSINEEQEGQRTVSGTQYTWTTINPRSILHDHLKDAAREGQAKSWIIVISRSPEDISAALSDLKERLLILFIILTILFAIGSAVIARFRAATQVAVQHEKMLQEARIFTNSLLRSAMEERSLEDEMQYALEMILSISWVSLLARGSIFITDEATDELVMVAEKDLAKPLLTSCARLQMGQCICGKAASTRQMIFTNCLDHQHEITFPGISEHGHICTPILKGDKVLGVINLYVEHHHEYNPLYKDLMTTIANTLAGIIERKKTDLMLVEALSEVRLARDTLAGERAIVEETLAKIRDAENFNSDGIRYLMDSVDRTAGDILLSSSCPDGVHYCLLGDFTGHGLPSAMASPTVADIFYSMTSKGLPPEVILDEVNTKLFQKLPARLFLAATFIALDRDAGTLSVWNSGLPGPILYREGGVLERFPSASVPLGILPEVNFFDTAKIVEYQKGDRLYAFTDGVIEAAEKDTEEMFGEERLEAMLSQIIREDLPLEALLEVVTDFQGTAEHADDITLLEVSVSNEG